MTLSKEELYCSLALNLVPGIGPGLFKTLLSYHRSAEAIFSSKAEILSKTPGIGTTLAHRILSFYKEERKIIDKEWAFIEKNNIYVLPYHSPEYPQKLKSINVAPSLLFYKGATPVNAFTRTVAVVGTRKATPYGLHVTKKIVEEMKAYHVCIVSGLAYGIDVAAHKAALELEVPTLAVVAHGLDRIYPSTHAPIARRMTEMGGILTEYPSGVKPDRENFPLRNRIVAGICDVIIVVEAAESGGALITADFASSFNREVFAVPGRITDLYSNGTNHLIRLEKAFMYTSAEDVVKKVGWDHPLNSSHKPRMVQINLLPDLTDIEQEVYQAIKEREKIHIDQLRDITDLPLSRLIPILTELEIKGVVLGLPGKIYQAL
ncbi:MAG: DNA-processing protein DprA [Thermaurantimonas sp.]